MYKEKILSKLAANKHYTFKEHLLYGILWPLVSVVDFLLGENINFVWEHSVNISARFDFNWPSKAPTSKIKTFYFKPDLCCMWGLPFDS